MTKPQELFIAALLLGLTTPPLLRAQSPVVKAQPTLGNPADLSGHGAPPDGVMGAGDWETAQGLSGAPDRKAAILATVQGAKSSLVAGGIPGQMPRVCFQPGIGWQSLPTLAFKPVNAVGSLTNDSPETFYAQFSGRKHVMSSDCPVIPLAASTAGPTLNNFIGQAQVQDANSVRTSGMNAGVQDWLHSNSLLNPASSASAQSLTMGISASSFSKNHLSEDDEGTSTMAQVDELASRAYVSSIELRRMMRNTHDLETRIKLREFTDRLAEKERRHAGTDKALGHKTLESHLGDRYGDRRRAGDTSSERKRSEVESYRKTGDKTRSHTNP